MIISMILSPPDDIHSMEFSMLPPSRFPLIGKPDENSTAY